MKINFTNSVAKEVLENLKILAGKDAKLYIMAAGQAVEEHLPVTFINKADRSQHIFQRNAEKPADLEEGTNYLEIAVKTANFIKILSILVDFDADIYISKEGGKYYIGCGNKAKTPLEVMEVTEEDKNAVIMPKNEKNLATVVIPAEMLQTMFRKGAASVETDKTADRGTENVCLHLNKEELSVSSLDGVKVSFASNKAKVKYTDESAEQDVLAGVKFTALKQLQTLIASADNVNIIFGEKNIFLATRKNEVLSVGRAAKVMPGENFLKNLIAEKEVGKLVVDSGELSAALKTVLSLSEEKSACRLSISKDTLNLSIGETETVCKLVTSSDGLNGGEYYYSAYFLNMLVSSLDKGNLHISLKGAPETPKMFLKNEKGAAMALLMPTRPPKREETKEDAAKEEAEETEDAE